jgi:hypothetical protein
MFILNEMLFCSLVSIVLFDLKETDLQYNDEKKKRTKEQTMIDKILHRNIKIEQH